MDEQKYLLSGERPTDGVRIAKLKQTCTACPSQWDAWGDDGSYYYVRFRWGCLEVDHAASQDEWWDKPERTLYHLQLSDGLDGLMTTEQMLIHTGFVFDGE